MLKPSLQGVAPDVDVVHAGFGRACIATVIGNVGPVDLLRIRETLALLLDLP